MIQVSDGKQAETDRAMKPVACTTEALREIRFGRILGMTLGLRYILAPKASRECL